MPTSPETYDARDFGRRCVGRGSAPPVGFPFTFSFASGGYFLSRKKVPKELFKGGEGFRFPSPLKNLSLKRPKREGRGPPLGNTSGEGVSRLRAQGGCGHPPLRTAIGDHSVGGDAHIAPYATALLWHISPSVKTFGFDTSSQREARGADSHASDVGHWLGNDRARIRRRYGRRLQGRTASRRRGMRLYNGAQTLGSPFGRAVTAGD